MNPKMQLAEKLTPEEFFKKVAMDIGTEVAHHIETMYPDAVKAASSTFLLSVRNCTYNQIMAASKVIGWENMLTRLEDRKKFRKEMKAFYRQLRVSAPAPDKSGEK